MFLAFGICIPLAAFFAHYHRNSELFQAHYWINTFGTLGLSLVAFALAAVYHTSSQTPHFASAHSIFGIVILFWLCLQQVGGCVLHYFYDERIKAHRDGRGVGPWVHIASGSLCLLGGIASCGLGIWRYQEWLGCWGFGARVSARLSLTDLFKPTGTKATRNSPGSSLALSSPGSSSSRACWPSLENIACHRRLPCLPDSAKPKPTLSRLRRFRLVVGLRLLLLFREEGIMRTWTLRLRGIAGPRWK